MRSLSPELEKEIRSHIKLHKDFPRKGVAFLDIGPLFRQPALRKTVMHYLAQGIFDHYGGSVDSIAAIESRGFAFGEAVSDILNIEWVMIRKEGKLPGELIREEYSTEYKERNVAEIQTEAIKPGQRVLLLDDVLATGGTFEAAHKLITRLSGKVVGIACLASIDSFPPVSDPQKARMKAMGISPYRLLSY